MDLWGIIGTALTFLLGITGIWAFVSKALPKIMAVTVVAKDAIDMVYDVLDAIKDQKITAEEQAEIKRHADALLADFKALLGKK